MFQSQKSTKAGESHETVSCLLWSPCVADADIIFLSRFFFFLFFLA